MKKLLASFLIATVFCSPATTAYSAPAAKQSAPAPKAPSPALTSLALALHPSQRSKLMYLLNYVEASVLTDLPGIGNVRAKAILDARPFAAPLDLLRVSGIGEAIMTDILNHARAGFPKPRAKRKS